jgi:integrase
VLPAVAAHLLAYAEPGDDGLLFYASRSADGARPYLRRSNFYQRVWKPALKASGLPRFRVHDLRHAAATMAAQTGSTTAELMAHLGHSTPAAAMRYQHASQERLRTMAERMGDLFPLPAATGTDNVVPLQP